MQSALHGGEVELPWVKHVEVDLLYSVGDVEARERQVLECPREAPEVSQISNRRPRLGVDLGLCAHRYQNWLAVHHANSLKNIERKLLRWKR
jgi:hypothetical protein